MRNPWLDVPLADYEGHMSLPRVRQAQALANHFAQLLAEFSPRSVAVMGCAGGNGFERIDPRVTGRVVGVDINPDFIKRARRRFSGRFHSLELYTADLQSDELSFLPVDLVYAALVLEYVDLPPSMVRLAACVKGDGALAVVLQLPDPSIPEVTPTRFRSLQGLAGVMRLKAPEAVRAAAEEAGLAYVSGELINLPSGKRFRTLIFRRATGRSGARRAKR